MTDLTLRELLRDLSRDPAAQAEFGDNPDGYLAAHGFDLSPELLGEAIVSVSANLPPEAAEHLSPFTMAHSPIPTLDDSDGSMGAEDGMDALRGLELLTTVPPVDPTIDEGESLDGGEGFGEGSAVGSGLEPDTLDGIDVPGPDPLDLDEDPSFGIDGLDSFELEGTGLEAEDSGDATDEPSLDDNDPADLDDFDILD